MKELVIVLLLAILALVVWQFWKPYVRSPVASLPSNEATLYFFYTEWCGFSQKAMPEWQKLRSGTYGTTRVTLKEVDADADKKKAEAYGVEAYPMILLETREGIHTYNGKRRAEDIEAFLQTMLGKKA